MRTRIAKKSTVELMDAVELARWQAARTMPQLGQMMAAWYARDVVSRPGLRPRVAPDPLIGDTPGMRNALVAVNKVGLVTIKAQPGSQNLPSAGHSWVTLCAAQGFISRPHLETLLPRLDEEGIRYRVWPVRPMWKLLGGDGVTVAYQSFKPTYPVYGRQMSAGQIRAEFDACHPHMIATLVGSQQITMWHPVSGCNDLWQLLTDWSFYNA